MQKFESLSIGAGWCQALSDYSVDRVGCSLAGSSLLFGIGLRPSHDGIRRMRRTNLPTRPCRKAYGRHRDSKRTRLIHRPCGGHRSAVGGIRVFSCWFPIVHYRTRSPSNHPCCQGCAAPSDTPGHVAAASSLVLHDPDLDLLSYANQSFAFKRETGVTPTQWRKGDDFQ
jgi:hypothetical protein